MKTANVATTRNQLSRLLRRIKRGESIVITERNHPIARLQPISADSNASPALDSLYEAGVLTPPAQPVFNLDRFLALPAPALAAGHDLTTALLVEREESR